MTRPSTPQKVSVITGASQGIGAGLVAAFRDAGYAVVGTSRSIRPASDSDFLTVPGDITDPATAQHVVDQALDRFGRIDSLINNAGVFIGKPFTDYTLDDFALITAVNLAGFFHITQRVVHHMVTQGKGHIVNISTSLVDRADSTTPAGLSALTKGGLVAVTRSLAIEYASRGLRVNAISAGVIQTPDHDAATYEGYGCAPSPWPDRPDQRHRRRDPVSRTGHLRDGRDLASTAVRALATEGARRSKERQARLTLRAHPRPSVSLDAEIIGKPSLSTSDAVAQLSSAVVTVTFRIHRVWLPGFADGGCKRIRTDSTRRHSLFRLRPSREHGHRPRSPSGLR
jgi:NAD(P)-dependent dehydrogenase (short-subunit alcohol dehydrogenase family)